MLRTEAASGRASAFATLSAEYARKVAGAKSHLKGPELTAALNTIRQHHLAAEHALASKLSHDTRIRRRAVLSALRTKREAQGKNFQTAAAHGNPRHSTPESVLIDRGQFRVRGIGRRRPHAKPKR